MQSPPLFVLVVVGLDRNNLLKDTGALSSIHIQGGNGCPNCASGSMMSAPKSGPYLIPTNAAEMYVLEFIDQAQAQTWVDETIAVAPTAFDNKIVYGHHAPTTLPTPP